MEKQEKEESASSLPVLPRIERLDRLLQLLEEKHSLSRRHLGKNTEKKSQEEEEGDQCKSLSYVLDEVQHKGTLMERLTILENRVLQLSLDMDEENTSKSSSSTGEKLDHGFESSTGDSKQEIKDEIKIHQGIQSPVSVQAHLQQDQESPKRRTCDVEKKGDISSRKQSNYKKSYKKYWLGWLRMGC